MNHGNASSALKTAIRGASTARGTSRAAFQGRAVANAQQRTFITPAYNLAKKVREISRRRGEEEDDHGELNFNWLYFFSCFFDAVSSEPELTHLPLRQTANLALTQKLVSSGWPPGPRQLFFSRQYATPKMGIGVS